MPYDEPWFPAEDLGPYELRREFFVWMVSRPDYWGGGYKNDRCFLRKENAVARLVELALKGEKVKF